jgi:histone H3/H4
MNLLILKINFDKMIKKIFQKMKKSFRIQSIALLILQKAMKIIIVKKFEDNICQYYFRTF